MTYGSILSRIGRLEWPMVVAFLVVATGLWAFIELADEVVEGSTTEFDTMILLALRTTGDVADPLGPQWLEEMMRDFTALGGGGVLALVSFAALLYLTAIGKRRAALAVLVAVGGGLLLSTLIKIGFDRPRPELTPHGSYVATASFPSGHSMMSAVVYLTLAVMLARFQTRHRLKVLTFAFAVVVVLLVGISRVYLGVHWPSDVAAGWTVGAAWATGCWLALLGLQRHGDIEPED